MPSLKTFNTNVSSMKHVWHFKMIKPKLKLRAWSFDLTHVSFVKYCFWVKIQIFYLFVIEIGDENLNNMKFQVESSDGGCGSTGGDANVITIMCECDRINLNNYYDWKLYLLLLLVVINEFYLVMLNLNIMIY